MASASCGSKRPLPMKEATHSYPCKRPSPMKETSPNYPPYPPPLAKYEDVVVNPNVFMDSLEKLHASLGSKFMIPIIGGKELDLHRLFVEVTSRGGIEKIIRERRWKEVTAVFNFPSTATNASFVLRKYYFSLLHHYERIYFFKAQGPPVSSDSLMSPSTTPIAAQRTESLQPTPETHAAVLLQQRINTAELPGARSVSSSGTSVNGVIDGKFESGYLVTVMLGSEKLKGVLYLAPQNTEQQVPQNYSVFASKNKNSSTVPGIHRRRRRKKSEIKRRDPAHPKPNRSGYNFFFAEQHARLKPLHPGKDRDISRMIGELWNKLKEPEKSVYQEKAIKDKERYRLEMEDYRERMRTGQVISDAVPLQQRLPGQNVNIVEASAKTEANEGGSSPRTPDNESSGKSDFDDDKTEEKDSDVEASLEVGVGAESSNVGMETSVVEDFELQKREADVRDDKVKVGDKGEEIFGDNVSDTMKEPVSETMKEPVPSEEH
ncbi:high mobility group B protein 15 [Fagus crenata]